MLSHSFCNSTQEFPCPLCKVDLIKAVICVCMCSTVMFTQLMLIGHSSNQRRRSPFITVLGTFAATVKAITTKGYFWRLKCDIVKEWRIPCMFSGHQQHLMLPFEPYQQASPSSLYLPISTMMPTCGFHPLWSTDWEIQEKKENRSLALQILVFFASQPSDV